MPRLDCFSNKLDHKLIAALHEDIRFGLGPDIQPRRLGLVDADPPGSCGKFKVEGHEGDARRDCRGRCDLGDDRGSPRSARLAWLEMGRLEGGVVRQRDVATKVGRSEIESLLFPSRLNRLFCEA